ncbi:hypothetical protein EV182_003220 [Spiromyces aspiralis]|uniref:Uncharacterized protein n=1 Tax=Spiromyces aspiralis TaxID=68401 RepID=A0ACC1HT68_9FUNG|nr:hypothetical protein EV182_003220 [Spiromyces aspiralis]
MVRDLTSDLSKSAHDMAITNCKKLESDRVHRDAESLQPLIQELDGINYALEATRSKLKQIPFEEIIVAGKPTISDPTLESKTLYLQESKKERQAIEQALSQAHKRFLQGHTDRVAELLRR